MDSPQILNIRIAPDELAEVDPSDPRRALKRVLKSDFLSGQILVGRISERPIPISLIAVPLLAIGMVMTASVIRWLVYGGVRDRWLITMILLLPGGVWLLWDAWRRAPCILIQTRARALRLEIKCAGAESLAQLQQAASARGFHLVMGRVFRQVRQRGEVRGPARSRAAGRHSWAAALTSR